MWYPANRRGAARNYVYIGTPFIARSAYGFLGRYQKDNGCLYVHGGSVSMPRSGVDLSVGTFGNGVCEISDGGTVEVNGTVSVLWDAKKRVIANSAEATQALYPKCRDSWTLGGLA